MSETPKETMRQKPGHTLDMTRLREYDLPFESLPLNDILKYLDSAVRNIIATGKTEVDELKVEHSGLQDKTADLHSIFINGDIGKKDYLMRLKKISDKRADLLNKIAAHDEADEGLSEIIIGLVRTAYERCKNSGN